jgi:hypothetical protein
MYGAIPAAGIPGYPMPGAYPPPVHYQDPYAPAQQYQAAPQPPAFVPEAGTLDEYLGQKAAGAQYWKFAQPGAVNIGMFERDPRDSDVAQVMYKGQPRRRADGSISQEKSLTLPIVNQDGTKALIEFQGHQRTAFEEAVSAATNGASRLPKGGGMLRGEFTHTEPSNGGGSPKKIIKWDYVPPEAVQAPQHAAVMAAQPQHVQQALQQPTQAAPAPAPQQAPPPPPQPHWDGQQWVYPQAGPAPAPQQAAPAQYAAPPAAAAYPQAAPAQPPAPQGPPPPQQYAPPGMDPAAAAQFAGLMGSAAQ